MRLAGCREKKDPTIVAVDVAALLNGGSQLLRQRPMELVYSASLCKATIQIHGAQHRLKQLCHLPNSEAMVINYIVYDYEIP